MEVNAISEQLNNKKVLKDDDWWRIIYSENLFYAVLELKVL